MNKIRPVISGRTAFVAALRNFCVLGCTAVENARRRQRPPGIFHITSALAVVRMRCAMMRTACFVQSGRGRGRRNNGFIFRVQADSGFLRQDGKTVPLFQKDDAGKEKGEMVYLKT